MTLNNLKEAWGDLGNLERKRELLEILYTARVRTLGEEDPATQKTRQRLEEVRKTLYDTN